MKAAGRLDDLREAYVRKHPESCARHERAQAWMPGGNTRSVLHFDPFPLVIVSGRADMLTDVDGYEYIDCAGEFSAGLYGHSDPVIVAALHEVLDNGLVLSGPNTAESELAELLCQRFPSLERLRFCNSGTEANLFALLTAINATGRKRVLVFEDAYHGGVLTFAGGGSPMNVPFDFVTAPFNDIESTRASVKACGNELAAILVEPLLGAAGNIPAEAAFLAMLREEAARCGAVLIFDEVKTSRLGRAGLQGHYGIVPDMTTLGKYLGAGLSFGAFGGSKALMDRFDPRLPGALKHAGTFNNNIMSMSGGLAGLRSSFTPDAADAFLQRTEAFRATVNARLAQVGLDVCLSGIGSILSLHIGAQPPMKVAQIHPQTMLLRQLVHLNCLERGLLLTPRGDIFLSLPMNEARLGEIAEILVNAVIQESPALAD
ncbi:MAG: aminotransferase class III-fold pyridoxal phosphate-dependent enzyme [Aquamicrobium sp.]|nr:aminotransferase class III-fold pyridoxal phosphate-dependent enzyme [Rhizobium sp.]MBX9463886.1 aminotransferase class III-fold pyridoxal phosphate-dependent enzyme [Aquamicrobium sp.]